ncbi:transporter substrate-binding domain-containing protein [Paucibacter sp. APW11]|uniref:Transporter substrate-binding domain-containing protein n=1 Tax=Roseateles aquae TaxID=3077235 RepID=A0ABU3PIL3_9BURK|nr:transporter substrate-binding domain-containing protein [Paucibacter sp. APW11]MDT9001861.1 transporter substrate-binding domain-containing protein [Paucibacter sp. APW11]
MQMLATLSRAGFAAVLLLATASQAAPVRRFVTEPFAPYNFEQQGRAAGPMVDLLKAACERLQWQCTIEVLPWRRALGQAERGEVDGIFALLETPQRRAQYRFTAPLIDARYTLFSRSGQSFVYSGRDSLQGREIGVYGPSGSSAALAELSQGVALNSHIEPDNLTVLKKLIGGRYGEQGLAFMNESVALYLLREHKLAGLQAAGTVREFGYSIALVKQRVSEADAKALDEALQANCRSGRNAELIRAYALPAAACAAPH